MSINLEEQKANGKSLAFADVRVVQYAILGWENLLAGAFKAIKPSQVVGGRAAHTYKTINQRPDMASNNLQGRVFRGGDGWCYGLEGQENPVTVSRYKGLT